MATGVIAYLKPFVLGQKVYNYTVRNDVDGLSTLWTYIQSHYDPFDVYNITLYEGSHVLSEEQYSFGCRQNMEPLTLIHHAASTTATTVVVGHDTQLLLCDQVKLEFYQAHIQLSSETEVGHISFNLKDASLIMNNVTLSGKRSVILSAL
jgi:hypothetical protein